MNTALVDSDLSIWLRKRVTLRLGKDKALAFRIYQIHVSVPK